MSIDANFIFFFHRFILHFPQKMEAFVLLLGVFLMLQTISFGFSESSNENILLDSPTDNAEKTSNKMLRIGMFGWETKRKERLLYSLLDSPPIIRSGNDTHEEELFSPGTTYKFIPPLNTSLSENHPIMQFEKKKTSIHKNDAAFLMIDELSFMNEQLLLSDMIDCMGSLHYPLLNATTTTTSRPLIVVVYSGAESLLPKVQALLKEAWTHCQMNGLVADALDGDFFTTVQTRFILAPSGLGAGQRLSPVATEAVKNLLGEVAQHLPTSTVETTNKQSTIRPLRRKKPVSPESQAIMEVFQEAVQVGLQKAVRLVNDERAEYFAALNQLQRDPAKFSGLLEDIILQSFASIDAFVADSGVGAKKLSAGVRTALRREVLVRIFKSFAPLFQRQVQLIKQTHIEEFNELTNGENLPITVFIDEDMQAVQRQTSASFARHVRLLVPRHRDITSLVRGELYWTATNDELELRALLQDFVDRQIARYRVLGVLSRQVRKPVSVSAHALVTHPLGLRDYRQDVLASLGDTFEYDEDIAALASSGSSPSAASSSRYSQLLQKVRPGANAVKENEESNEKSFTPQSPVLIKPKLARELLEQQAQDLQADSQGFSWRALTNRWKLHQVRKQSETAREMLMFPLCIKNPAVPMTCSPEKRAMRRGVAVPQFDHEREIRGPERYTH